MNFKNIIAPLALLENSNECLAKTKVGLGGHGWETNWQVMLLLEDCSSSIVDYVDVEK